MTVAEHSAIVGAGLPALPRVNLLPPEIAERHRFRQVQYGLGGLVAAALFVVVLLYLAAAHSVSTANDRLAAEQQRGQQLTGQMARYSNVTAVYAQAEASKAMLVQAMSQEIRFSRLLNDLALSIPDNVWLSSLGYTEGAVAPAVGATAGGVGTITVSATGFSHDDVAVWLDTLAGQPDYVSPDFGSSTETLLGFRKAVTFSSTATLSTSVLSGRYTTPIGG